jgi:hypothetical protein
MSQANMRTVPPVASMNATNGPSVIDSLLQQGQIRATGLNPANPATIVVRWVAGPDLSLITIINAAAPTKPILSNRRIN